RRRPRSLRRRCRGDARVAEGEGFDPLPAPGREAAGNRQAHEEADDQRPRRLGERAREGRGRRRHAHAPEGAQDSQGSPPAGCAVRSGGAGGDRERARAGSRGGVTVLSWLANAWRVPELRRRVLFTAVVLSFYRLGSWVPAPGVNSSAIQNYFGSHASGGFGLLSLFSGGALSRFSIFALGIMPYVTASIILQLMTAVVPSLEQLKKEGESGYAKITQYTRYLTVGFAAAQSIGYGYLFKREHVLNVNSGRLVLIVITLTAGMTLLMWMGELITKRGIGNGISLLIFASILTSAPAGISAWINGGPFEKLFFPLVALGVIVAVVFVQEGQRRIPIQYAKRMVGRRQTAGGATYMPLGVNMAGVIPVIFAAAVLALPQTIGSFAPATQ